MVIRVLGIKLDLALHAGARTVAERAEDFAKVEHKIAVMAQATSGVAPLLGTI